MMNIFDHLVSTTLSHNTKEKQDNTSQKQDNSLAHRIAGYAFENRCTKSWLSEPACTVFN